MKNIHLTSKILDFESLEKSQGSSNLIIEDTLDQNSEDNSQEVKTFLTKRIQETQL